MTAEDLARLHAALDVLEGREAELLVWGDTEGAFTDADILSLFAHHFPDENGKILMQDLQDAAMLFSIPNTKGTRLYRTRMAESVHLFRHQRQWFRGQQLSRTRTLVADYRFIRRPRSYPERKYPAEKVLSQLSDVEWMNDIKRQALRALIGDFSIAGFQSRATARILRAWDFHSNHTRVKEATATIVCAGTGSGKTLAFYLPALTSLINDLQRDRSARVRTLALYPRKELLKDQFMETWGNAEKWTLSQLNSLDVKSASDLSLAIPPTASSTLIKTKIFLSTYCAVTRLNAKAECAGKRKISAGAKRSCAVRIAHIVWVKTK